MFHFGILQPFQPIKIILTGVLHLHILTLHLRILFPTIAQFSALRLRTKQLACYGQLKYIKCH